MSDTEEIFITAESETRLDLIRHLIENSELVPLVRGVSGIGKTLLASRLQASAPQNWVVCHFAADSMMQPERLLAQIARCNGLPDAQEDNLRRLIDRFEMQRKRGNVPVLLIDDAQELPPTSLITLLRLYERQVDGTPLVSLVLFADEQIDMLLSTPQLQIMSPQSIQVIDLPPLTAEEADTFMRHLLKTEGLDPGLALDSNRMSRVYRETGGAPGRLASAILEAVGESGGDRESGGGMLNRPLFWGALSLGILLLLLVVYREPVRQMLQAQKEPSGEAVAQVSPPQPSPAAPEETPAVSAVTRLPEPAEVPTSPADPTPSPASEVETPPSAAAETAPKALDTAVPATAESAVTAVDAAERTAPQAAPAPPAPPADAARPAALVAAPEIEAAAETEVAGGTSQEVPATVKSDETAAPESPPLLKSSDWLREQAPASYTIQLLAGEKIESISDVVEKYDLPGEVFTLRTQRQGRTWYPLLWGRFGDRKAAEDALKRLPAELQKAGAWVRSFASLQQ